MLSIEIALKEKKKKKTRNNLNGHQQTLEKMNYVITAVKMNEIKLYYMVNRVKIKN